MFAGAQTVARRPASAEPAACRQRRRIPSKQAPAAASAKSKYHRLSTKTKTIRCKRTRAEEPQEAKGKDGEDKTQGLKAADPVEDPDAKPKTKASRARRSGHIPAQETGDATHKATRGCHLGEQKLSEVLGAALLQSHLAVSSAGICAEPKGPPARQTSKAKLTQHKLAMLPERYRSGYELAVNDLGRREICLPAGATAGTAATRWHSYIHGSHLIKVTCRELAQDIPADLLLPADASAEVTATWLLALMDRKELLLPGYPEVRKLPSGYRREEVSSDQCNCFISALWHIRILLVLVFVSVYIYIYIYILVY